MLEMPIYKIQKKDQFGKSHSSGANIDNIKKNWILMSDRNAGYVIATDTTIIF